MSLNKVFADTKVPIGTMKNITYIATAAFGLEACVKREVERLNGAANISVSDGKIRFEGGIELLAEANINLSCADRVQILMAEFEAKTFDELYDNVHSLEWENWITKDGKFPVEGKSVKSTLSSVPACQKIVKKAVSDRLMKKYSSSWLHETGAQYTITVSIIKDIATLTIDTSGPGLHKRGYRIKNYTAPLKETLAASLLDLSYYFKDKVFFDPFCGSGTLAIEAALKSSNTAPGLKREFVSQKWKNIDDRIWNDAKQRANEKINKKDINKIIACDINPVAIKLAKENAANAGVSDLIEFRREDFNNSVLPEESGTIICNPPYAERIGDENEVRALYRNMGAKLKKSEWEVNVLTGFNGFDKLYGKKPDKMRKIYNGNIQTFLYQYYKRKDRTQESGKIE